MEKEIETEVCTQHNVDTVEPFMQEEIKVISKGIFFYFYSQGNTETVREHSPVGKFNIDVIILTITH